MRRLTIALPIALLSLTSCCVLQGCCKILEACSPSDTPADNHDGWSHFGAETDAHNVKQVAMGELGGPVSGADSHVKVEGTITEVCAVKGCWMKLRGDNGEAILVRFKDYGFFVPRNASGRRAWLTGTAERVELSVDALRHIAEDAGKSAAEVAAITSPQTTVTFMADAVWIQGPGLQDPYRPIGQESCDAIDSGSKPAPLSGPSTAK
jgi:Domain of unknown function (DUF4920)